MRRFGCRGRPEGPWLNGTRLYRDPARGKLFGVCAGLADYFGMRHGHMRLLAILFLLVFPPQSVVLYLIAALVMRPRPDQARPDDAEDAFRRTVAGRPDQSLHALRHNFRQLEERLASLERHVTSREYALNREFRDLEP